MDAFSLLQRLQRPDLEDLDEDDHIIDWVSAFTADDEFVGAVDSFISKHASEFQDSKEESAGGVSSGEFSLVHTELYNQFLAMTEAKIEAFLASKGYDSKTFYRLCREEVERTQAAQRNTTRSFFVQLLLAGSEFGVFAAMMKTACTAAEDALQKLQETAVQVKELLDATADESKGADSVDINFDDAQREALSEECARVLAWVESHPKATLADITAREEAMDAIVNPIIIAGDRAARK